MTFRVVMSCAIPPVKHHGSSPSYAANRARRTVRSWSPSPLYASVAMSDQRITATTEAPTIGAAIAAVTQTLVWVVGDLPWGWTEADLPSPVQGTFAELAAR